MQCYAYRRLPAGDEIHLSAKLAATQAFDNSTSILIRKHDFVRSTIDAGSDICVRRAWETEHEQLCAGRRTAHRFKWCNFSVLRLWYADLAAKRAFGLPRKACCAAACTSSCSAKTTNNDATKSVKHTTTTPILEHSVELAEQLHWCISHVSNTKVDNRAEHAFWTRTQLFYFLCVQDRVDYCPCLIFLESSLLEFLRKTIILGVRMGVPGACTKSRRPLWYRCCFPVIFFFFAR